MPKIKQTQSNITEETRHTGRRFVHGHDPEYWSELAALRDAVAALEGENSTLRGTTSALRTENATLQDELTECWAEHGVLQDKYKAFWSRMPRYVWRVWPYRAKVTAFMPGERVAPV